MGHNLATWKLLEDMLLELKKTGVNLSPKIVDDLRTAKSMLKISSVEGSHGEVLQKTEEYLFTVESYLVTEGQKVFGSKWVDELLIRIEDAASEVSEKTNFEEDKFVTGVPRLCKWIRIDPINGLSTKQITQLAKQQKLEVNQQQNGKLVICGQQEQLKSFLKSLSMKKPNKTK